MAIFDRGQRQNPAVLLDEEAPADDAASSSSSDNGVAPQWWFALASVVTFVIGVWVAVALFGTADGPTFTAPEGIGAFALFYVIAQAAERLLEMAMPVLNWIPGLDKPAAVQSRDGAVVSALNAVPAADPPPDALDSPTAATIAADAQARLDQVRANRGAITFAVTATVGMLACAYLEADFLSAVGVNFGSSGNSEWFRMAVTGLVVGGGSAKLHGLISNMSKSSAKKDDPAATGGSS